MQFSEKLWRIGENIETLNCNNRMEKNYLVSEPNYHTAKFFTENVLDLEMRKTQIVVNKLVYLGLSTLDLSKTNTWFLV